MRHSTLVIALIGAALATTPAAIGAGQCSTERAAERAAASSVRGDTAQLAAANRALAGLGRQSAHLTRLSGHVGSQLSQNESEISREEAYLETHCHGAATRESCRHAQQHLDNAIEYAAANTALLAEISARQDELAGEAVTAQSVVEQRQAVLAADQVVLADAKEALASCTV